MKRISAFLSRLRGHVAFRALGLGVTLATAIAATAVVCGLTLDIGPPLRQLAERQGTKLFHRPLHIGRLSIRLLRGHVALDDLVIEGLEPTARPFFKAGHLALDFDWGTLGGRELTISSVELSDWTMLVESWEGRHSFPKIGEEEEPEEPPGPKRFTTTLKYFHAVRGEFAYEDHERPWSTVSRNLDLTITNLPRYNGVCTFTAGTVTIQDYVPMWTNMQARFTIDGGTIHMDRIDLDSDGAKSVAMGDVDVSNWPEMSYRVESRLQFERMRELFFAHEAFRLSGDGDFSGTFRLFKGGHDLRGTFASTLAGVNEYRFPSLYGSLEWTPDHFEVSNAGAKLFDGDARFAFSIKPLGAPAPPTQRFEASYTGVDVAAFTDFEQLPGLRFAGRASGRHLLEWSSGHFSEHRGEGRVDVAAPPGAAMMTPAILEAERAADAGHQRHEWGPFAPSPLPTHLPIAGELTYTYDGSQIRVQTSQFATEKTQVAFQGTSAWGDRSHVAFHVVSRDWQESDQLLAGVLTDFGSPTGVVAFGGRGDFDGVMTGNFRRPRIEGEFAGEDLRAWDTVWGSGTAHVAFEDGYLDVTDGVIVHEGSEVRTDGRFAVDRPQGDTGDDIDARFRVVRRDVDSLRHAFQIDSYPVSGLLTGEFHLKGEYGRPIGFGAMTVDNGIAYSEPFQRATSSLRFEGAGVRFDGLSIVKGSGLVTGAAYIGWDSTYSFNANGRHIPIDQISALSYPQLPLSGIAEFSASGSATFDQPRYDVRFRINDLFLGDEGVGQVTASLALRGRDLTGEFEAASPRLAVTGAGRIALTSKADVDVALRFHDSSLDPYVRLFVPRLSPFTTAVASGTIRIAGELTDVDRLVVDAAVESVDLRLFDYALHNEGVLRFSLDRHQVKIGSLQLAGEDTQLAVTGMVDVHNERIALQAAGFANLGVLQGFFRDVRGSGRAELTAAVTGPLRDPVFSGSATIVGGRIRHFSLPNSLDEINGTVRFDPRGIGLDDVTATMGDGRVQFGGRIGLEGYLPGDLSVTVRGEDMHLRYPEGVRSSVDMDLLLRGNMKAPTLAGTITVRSATWTKRIEAPGSLLELTGFRSSGARAGTPGPATDAAVRSAPLRFDLRVLVPSTLRVDNNLARLVASADLTLSGTSERPILFGHADVERGELTFEGRRYRVTRGTIDFTNPTRIEPFFDVETETTVRVPGQTYHVTINLTGSMDRMEPTVSSDPPLPAGDVIALLFGAGLAPGDAELRALQNPNERQADILTTRATQALASPLSSEVGKVVGQFGVDTFQVSPYFDPSTLQTGRVNPAARVTIGKRISDRVYLTFSRSLNSARDDQVILLEYDATDRFSLLLSRNEDQTYTLEFRARNTF